MTVAIRVIYPVLTYFKIKKVILWLVASLCLLFSLKIALYKI